MIAIAEQGNISRAAEQIHLTQSALSQCLAKEEREIGMPLFLRADRRLVPTDAGRLYLACAREMVGIKAETYRKIRQLELGRTCLRIVSVEQFIGVVEQRLLPELSKRFPALEYELTCTSSYLARQYLYNGLADIVFLCMQQTESSLLRCHPLYTDHACLVVPHALLTEEILRDGLPACGDLPFILPRRSSIMRAIIDQVLREARITVLQPREVDGISSVIEQVKKGLGAAFLPSRMCDEAVYHMFKAETNSSRYSVVCAVPSYTSPSPECDALYEIAVNHFTEGI